jgi:hypothetical protein
LQIPSEGCPAQSVDAVKDLGRAAVEMANTLDTAIENLLGSWSAPWSTETPSRSAKKTAKENIGGEGHVAALRGTQEGARLRTPLQELRNSARAPGPTETPREGLKSKRYDWTVTHPHGVP